MLICLGFSKLSLKMMAEWKRLHVTGQKEHEKNMHNF